MGLSPATLAAIDHVNYETPSPIQAAFIPIAITGRDCIGQARTGTGKTGAFVIPILERIDHTVPRVQALVRRATATVEPTRLEVGDLQMDLLARRVTRHGREIELRPREFALLEYLKRNAGRVISKTMILSRVWDYNFDPRTNVVDVLVHRLREKIDRDFEPKLLHTRRGIGYVLTADPPATAR